MGAQGAWAERLTRRLAATGGARAVAKELPRLRTIGRLILLATVVMLAACTGRAAETDTTVAATATPVSSSTGTGAQTAAPSSAESPEPARAQISPPAADDSPTPLTPPAAATALRPTGVFTTSPTALPDWTPTLPVTPSADLPAPQPLPTAWPVDGWPTSTPEEVGVDSGILADMFKYLPRDPSLGHGLMGLLAVRHGYLFLEAYFYPYDAEILGDLFSCTKSVTSILVGIAVAQGALEGVDQPVLELFPDRVIQNVDARKEAMTLEDLLTMNSGLDWSEPRAGYSDMSSPFQQWLRSNDQIQCVLDRPMVAEPGEWFEYNTGVSHLLSAIIQESTGMSTLDFAQQYLFGALGITDVSWQQDQEGFYTGGYGLQLKPRDMAKLGYLYLRHGE